jgi:hypothetical protein
VILHFVRRALVGFMAFIYAFNYGVKEFGCVLLMVYRGKKEDDILI